MLTHPLSPICQQWLSKIKLGLELKQERFQKYADECYAFFNGPANYQFAKFQEEKTGQLGESMTTVPYFQITVNRLFEAVALYGPVLMHKYPQATVAPVQRPFADPNDPMEQAKVYCATMKEHYSNWLQKEAGKKEEGRFAITEAIIKGMGLLWVDMHRPPGSEVQYPKAEYRSVDDLVLDPDAKYRKSIQWIAMRHVEPVYLVEQKFNLPPGSLQGHYQSASSQVTAQAKQEVANGHPKGKSYDLIEYWDIYSKGGFGEKLAGSTAKMEVNTEALGQFCRIVVAKDVPYPLNLPSEMLTMGEVDENAIMEAVQWPIPFWMDGGWPYAELAFYRDSNSVWPISIAKNGLGYLKFINWCLSFLADKTAASSTTYVAMMADAAKEIRDQLLSSHSPYKVIEISQMTGQNINEIVSFLKAPDFDINIWKMVDEVSQRFDKATGLSELLYGMTTNSLRTATEAEVKQQNVSIRPDDMSATTDDWLSCTISKEVQAMCWKCGFEDLAPVLGEEQAYQFLTYLTQMPADSVVREYSYTVVAESSRRPNKEGRRKALQELGQVIGPTLQQFAMQGMTMPWNQFVSDLAKAYEVEAAGYLVPEFQPPQAEAKPDPLMLEDAKHQHKIEQTVLEQAHESEENELDRESAEQIASKRAAAKPKAAGTG